MTLMSIGVSNFVGKAFVHGTGELSNQLLADFELFNSSFIYAKL